MVYDLRMKLKTPFLGNQQTQSKIRKFRRTDSGDIALDSAQWKFVISESIDSLAMDVNPEAVRLPLEFRAPKLNLYTRRWKDENGIHSEDFESISKGAVLTVKVLSLKQSENNIQPGPDQEELKLIFEFAGAWIGLSPWGSKFNYGRFDVLALEPHEPDLRRRPFNGIPDPTRD